MLFWDNLTLEDRTNWFSQNSGMDLPLTAAYKKRAGVKTCSISVCPSVRRIPNG